MKRYRFYFHYRRCDRRMSVHFQGQCMPCQNVICYAPCETHRQNRQPFLVVRGFARQVTRDRKEDTIVIR